MVKYNTDLEKPNKLLFSSDFPIDKVVEEVKKYIPSNKRLCEGVFEDHYIFKYDMCGRVNQKPEDYFKVICFAEQLILLLDSSHKSHKSNLLFLLNLLDYQYQVLLLRIPKDDKMYHHH